MGRVAIDGFVVRERALLLCAPLSIVVAVEVVNESVVWLRNTVNGHLETFVIVIKS